MLITSALEILDALPLKQNSVVLDIGSGIGNLTTEIRRMHPNSRILAIEHNKDKLQTLHNKNIKAIGFDVDNGNALPLKNNFCDVVLLAHTLRSLIYRESLLKECSRVLKPGGVLLIIESHVDSFGVATHPDSKIAIDDMLEYLDRTGFILGESFDTKAHEYGIISVCPVFSDY